jgi:quercetin dioxygenase-like cupin family protein
MPSFNNNNKLTLCFSLFVLIVTALPVQAQDFRDQRIVQILQEPRHRTVHRDGDVYLLDVQINPGDRTLPHTHDAAILYTFISNGDGPLYGRVSGNTDYVEQNFTHAVSNPGPNLFRIIALTNYGTGLPNASSDRPSGMEVEPEVENEWFRSYRISLQPGQTSSRQTHNNPTVVIQVTEGTAHVSREDGITTELARIGEWAWREEGSSFTVSNMGDSPIELVINEARR